MRDTLVSTKVYRRSYMGLAWLSLFHVILTLSQLSIRHLFLIAYEKKGLEYDLLFLLWGIVKTSVRPAVHFVSLSMRLHFSRKSTGFWDSGTWTPHLVLLYVLGQISAYLQVCFYKQDTHANTCKPFFKISPRWYHKWHQGLMCNLERWIKVLANTSSSNIATNTSPYGIKYTLKIQHSFQRTLWPGQQTSSMFRCPFCWPAWCFEFPLVYTLWKASDICWMERNNLHGKIFQIAKHRVIEQKDIIPQETFKEIWWLMGNFWHLS